VGALRGRFEGHTGESSERDGPVYDSVEKAAGWELEGRDGREQSGTGGGLLPGEVTILGQNKAGMLP